MDNAAIGAACAAAAGAAWYCCSSGSAPPDDHWGSPQNHSFFFIKPHAHNEAVEALVRQTLAASQIDVVSSGTISAAAIDDGGLIDKHYGTLAERAMDVPPAELPVWSEAKAAEFEKLAGQSHTAAAAAGQLLNLRQAQALLPTASPKEIERQWRAGECLKLAPGTYVAKLSEASVWVVNGFYASMRAKFTDAELNPAGIKWLQLRWDESALTWQAFRDDVVGATDCKAAREGSLRNLVLQRWEALGLRAAPVNTTACKRLFSLGCVPHTDGAVLQTVLLMYRGCTVFQPGCNGEYMGVASAPTWKGPYTRLLPRPILPKIYAEDPSM